MKSAKILFIRSIRVLSKYFLIDINKKINISFILQLNFNDSNATHDFGKLFDVLRVASYGVRVFDFRFAKKITRNS